MSPIPTYDDRAETEFDPPDENDPARRSRNRTTPDAPKTDAAIDPALLEPDPSEVEEP
jgi:hypothetical protein